MVVKRAIVIASFGNRWTEYLEPLLKNIRNHVDYDIWLYTNIIEEQPHLYRRRLVKETNLKWKDSSRWPVRNTNIWLARAFFELRDEGYDSICCLNDDMKIVNTEGFTDGFVMAERFGVCVPLNPRVFVKLNAMGADTTETDTSHACSKAPYAPACNMSPMYASTRSDSACALIRQYISELMTTMRGTLAFFNASWFTGITPLYLPEQYCVCGSSALFIKQLKKPLRGEVHTVEPIILHWGQREVREVFKDYANA